MVAVPRDSEGAPSDQRDIVRLRGIRDAGPVLREGVLIRELGHVCGWPIDVGQVVILHEHDDELVEVVRRGKGPHRAGFVGQQTCVRGEDREAQEDEKGGGRKGREHALRVFHCVFSQRPTASGVPLMLVFSPPARSDNRYG